MRVPNRKKAWRSGVAAVEFAVCFPVILLIFTGLMEVGRMVEIQQVAYNCAREAARDASMANDNLTTVATNCTTYLQAAEPQAFKSGTPTYTTATGLPSNTTGIKATLNSQELFTLTFSDITTTSVTDPTNATKLDNIQIGIQIPYASIALSPLPQITNGTRLYATVNWVCMKDTPFSVPTVLPAQ